MSKTESIQNAYFFDRCIGYKSYGFQEQQFDLSKIHNICKNDEETNIRYITYET